MAKKKVETLCDVKKKCDKLAKKDKLKQAIQNYLIELGIIDRFETNNKDDKKAWHKLCCAISKVIG